MSHITKDTEVDTSNLTQFADYQEMPEWGMRPFSKAIKYGLYVNYPLETELNPNRDLNKAEAQRRYKMYQRYAAMNYSE